MGPINNWIRATDLLNKHAIQNWHKTAIEKKVFADSAEKHGDIIALPPPPPPPRPPSHPDISSPPKTTSPGKG